MKQILNAMPQRNLNLHNSKSANKRQRNYRKSKGKKSKDKIVVEKIFLKLNKQTVVECADDPFVIKKWKKEYPDLIIIPKQ